jgi:hypothetical protein
VRTLATAARADGGLLTLAQVPERTRVYDAHKLRHDVLTEIKRRLLKGVRTGKRSANASGRVEWPAPTEDVARRAFPFLPPRHDRRRRLAVRLVGEQAQVFGNDWEYANRRSGEIFIAATVVHDQVPPRTFPIEIGLGVRRTRWLEREDGDAVRRQQKSFVHAMLYVKFSIFSFHKSIGLYDAAACLESANIYRLQHVTTWPLRARRLCCTGLTRAMRCLVCPGGLAMRYTRRASMRRRPSVALARPHPPSCAVPPRNWRTCRWCSFSTGSHVTSAYGKRWSEARCSWSGRCATRAYTSVVTLALAS